MITTLAELIALVESNNNPKAIRFEAAHMPAPEYAYRMRELCQCTFATAKVLCAMSWGKYQIMGDELIALGLDITPMEFCMDDDYQTEFFRRFIVADHVNLDLSDVLLYPDKRRLFARLYNGPGNVDGYAQRMLEVARANGLQVNL